MIVDEAHNIEHVAEEHFGLDISDKRISFLLHGLYNQKTKKGFLANTQHNEAVNLVKCCQKAADDFFKSVGQWLEADKGNGRNRRPGFVIDCISEPIKKFRLCLSGIAGQSIDADEQFEFLRFADLLTAIGTDLKNFLSQGDETSVYWVESEKNKRKTLTLKSAPINPAENIKNVCLMSLSL